MTGAPIIAVFGLGSIGLRHAGNLLDLGATVRGFDPDVGRRQALIELGGIAVASQTEALAGACGLVIASPSQMHLEDLKRGIEAGCHVFVEKPFSHTLDGTSAVVEAAEARGLRLFAGLNQRLNRAVSAARARLESGALGKILWARLIASSYLPDWRPGQDYRTNYAASPTTGGIIFDDIHEIDLANFLLGPAEVVSATARVTGALEIPSEDLAILVLRHVGGALSSIHMDFCTRPRQRVIDVAGTNGRLWIDVIERRLVHYATDGGVLEDTTWEDKGPQDYKREMAAFLDTVAGTAEPVCDGRSALRVLEQTIAARRMAGLPEA